MSRVKKICCPSCGHEFELKSARLLNDAVLLAFPDEFTLQQVRDKFPGYTDGTLRNRLAELVSERRLKKLGAGNYRQLRRK